MHPALRRLLVLALVVLMPAQSTFAAAGLHCTTPSDAHAIVAQDGDADHAMHHAGAGGDASEPARSGCSACAPCTGSAALVSVAFSGAADVVSGDDFLPVVVALRPARSDGLERPPRTI